MGTELTRKKPEGQSLDGEQIAVKEFAGYEREWHYILNAPSCLNKYALNRKKLLKYRWRARQNLKYTLEVEVSDV